MSFTREELMQEKALRMQKLDAMMAEQNLDAILFTCVGLMANKFCIKYAANTNVGTRRIILLKARGEEPYLFNPMGVPDKKAFAKRSWIDFDNQIFGNMLPGVAEKIAALPQEHPVIGVDQLSEIPIGVYDVLRGTKAKFVDVTEAFTRVRAGKSQFEIDRTREVCELGIASFEDLILRMKPGMTEHQLLGGAVGVLSEHGASELGLILGASKKRFANIRPASDDVLTEEDIFTYSAEFLGPSGYWMQIIRPVFMKRGVHPDALECLKVAREAERAAMHAARPGNRIKDIHFAVADTIASHGMEMTYWAGHGMGCDLGDGVDILPTNEMEIIPNMVLVIQPSVDSATNSILYGNTFLTREDGDAVILSDAYMDSPYYEDLYAEVAKKYGK